MMTVVCLSVLPPLILVAPVLIGDSTEENVVDDGYDFDAAEVPVHQNEVV